LRPVLVLDPGHGGQDSGVVSGIRREAPLALEAALTLKSLLVGAFDVRLTRDGTEKVKPDLSERVLHARAVGAVAFVSLHYNCARCGSMVYTAPGKPSERLGAAVGAVLRGCRRVEPSRNSRFGGLYVDAFPDWKPSILIELAGIDEAPYAGSRGRIARLELLTPIARVLTEHLT
jgi:N-acetylmuramoyl-L-alanine amidase